MILISILFCILVVVLAVYLLHPKSPVNLDKLYLMPSKQFVVYTPHVLENFGYTHVDIDKDIFINPDGILFLTQTNSAMKFLWIHDLERFLVKNEHILKIDDLKYLITKQNNYIIKAEIL